MRARTCVIPSCFFLSLFACADAPGPAASNGGEVKVEPGGAGRSATSVARERQRSLAGAVRAAVGVEVARGAEDGARVDLMAEVDSEVAAPWTRDVTTATGAVKFDGVSAEVVTGALVVARAALGDATPCPRLEDNVFILEGAHAFDSETPGGREGTATIRISEEGVSVEITWEDGEVETRQIDVSPEPLSKLPVADLFEQALAQEVSALTQDQIDEVEARGEQGVANFSITDISTIRAVSTPDTERDSFASVTFSKGQEYFSSHYFRDVEDQDTPREPHHFLTVHIDDAVNGAGVSVTYSRESVTDDCPKLKLERPPEPVILEGCVGKSASWDTPRAGYIVDLDVEARGCELIPNDGETPGTFLLSDGVGFKGQGDLYVTIFEPERLSRMLVDGEVTSERTLMVPVTGFGEFDMILTLELDLPVGATTVSAAVHIDEDPEGLNSVTMTISEAVVLPRE